MRPLRLVGLGGSLASPSTSLAALKATLEEARRLGATVRLFDLRSLALPMYDPAIDPPGEALELADAMHEADAIVWSAPLYHGSVSGAFKNALDWLQVLANRTPAYLSGKPVALIATAGGIQGLQAINTMEFIVRALRGWTVPLTVPIARAYQAFAPDGSVTEAAVAKQLALLAQETLAAARRFQPAPTPALASAPLVTA